VITAVAFAGLMAVSWPKPFAWLKPRTVPPSAQDVMRAHDRVSEKTYQLHGWYITIRRDGFTGQTRCRLYFPKTLFQGRITYARDTLGFQLDENRSTLRAWYRIDRGETRRWQDIYPRLAASGVPLDGEDFDNPTGGLVLIPAVDLAAAKTVDIRANDTAPVKTFRVTGFAAALAAAKDNGCTAQDSFERNGW